MGIAVHECTRHGPNCPKALLVRPSPTPQPTYPHALQPQLRKQPRRVVDALLFGKVLQLALARVVRNEWRRLRAVPSCTPRRRPPCRHRAARAVECPCTRCSRWAAAAAAACPACLRAGNVTGLGGTARSESPLLHPPTQAHSNPRHSNTSHPWCAQQHPPRPAASSLRAHARVQLTH